MALRSDEQHERDERKRRGREGGRGPDRFAERRPPALRLAHGRPEALVALVERTRDVVLVDVQRDANGRGEHDRDREESCSAHRTGGGASHQQQRRIRERDQSEPRNEADGGAPVPLDEQLRREATDRDDDEADEAAAQDRRVVGCRGPARHHGRLSAARIRLSVSADGLYFASWLFSFAKERSSFGYGRYSCTSMTQREAFGTPAASSAACSCAAVALLAEAFVVDAAAGAPVAPGVDSVTGDAAVALGAGAAAAPPHATSATAATMSVVNRCLMATFSVSGMREADHSAAPAA